ncbi:hypothetical protein OSTOST_16244 [Ostertagia ostertagi]
MIRNCKSDYMGAGCVHCSMYVGLLNIQNHHPANTIVVIFVNKSTFQVPFWDAYIIALHRKIKNDPVVFPETPHLSDPLKDVILGLLKKDPGLRLLLQEVKVHAWVTRRGTCPMPSEEENCHLVTVTEEEIENCVRVIPRLDTLILVKAMGHRKRFGNPFRNTGNSSLRDRRKSSSVKDPTYCPPSSITNGESRRDVNGLSEPMSKLHLSPDSYPPKAASARH